ncbi:hypothetical protein FBR02_06075 [Anaerolineae bacterium CFX9]|nr:hypothetical protein [Anaerolineae bacterium CFX9]
MKLPNADQAVVPEAKVLYLLSEEKSGGKDKFFKGFGFSVAQWEVLQAAVLRHAQTHEVAQVIDTDFGVKYIIEGAFVTPDERDPIVRSVWQIDHEDTIPRFVTAYPVKE